MLAAIRASRENLLTFPWIKQRKNTGTHKQQSKKNKNDSGVLLRYVASRDTFAPQVGDGRGHVPE